MTIMANTTSHGVRRRDEAFAGSKSGLPLGDGQWVPELCNFINGQFVEHTTNVTSQQGLEKTHPSWIVSESPASGRPLLRQPNSLPSTVDQAVQAAKVAFPSWSRTVPAERAKRLFRLADLVEREAERFALAESRDTGKPLALARRRDIPRVVYNFRFFAQVLTTISTPCTQQRAADGSSSYLNYVVRSPIGVAALISPWNLPLYLLTWKIAPCIAFGNTCVCKPSEFSPLTAALLAELVMEAEIPPGVVNIIFGYGGPPSGAGHSLVIHPDVSIISFTGGTTTGQNILRTCNDLNRQLEPMKSASIASPNALANQCSSNSKHEPNGATSRDCIAIASTTVLSLPRHFKRTSLELGGKNALIVFADASLSACIKTAVQAAFENQGEICLCASRILVEASIFEEFSKEFVTEVRKLRVGDPMDTDYTDVGALISAQHLGKVLSYLQLARELGGKILCGGRSNYRISQDTNLIEKEKSVDALHLSECVKDGYFIEPTVISGLSHDSRPCQEEIFGPIVTLIPFKEDAEAIKLANDCAYGLCASVWTENVGRLHRVAEALEVGTVWCNCWLMRDLNMPFGGVKASGIGREGARDSWDLYTEQKTICVKYA